MVFRVLSISFSVLRETYNECSIYKSLCHLSIARNSDLNSSIFIISSLDILKLQGAYSFSYNRTSSVLIA